MNDKYNAMRQKFNEGDWVFGLGEHKGCSAIFDLHTRAPQPFSYLDATNPDDFRLATCDERKAAKSKLCTFNYLTNSVYTYKEK